MTFHEMMLTDAQNNFLNDDEFAVEIAFLPAAGGSVSLSAVVFLGGRDVNTEDFSRTTRNLADVYIANDATIGRASIDVVSDKMQLTLPDGTTVTARIQEILSKDEGLWGLRVTW